MKNRLHRLALAAVIASSTACSSRYFANPTSVESTSLVGAIRGQVFLTTPTASFPQLLNQTDVVLTSSNGLQTHATPDGQGVFAFSSLPAGTFGLEVDFNPAPGTPDLFAARTSFGNVNVVAGQTTTLDGGLDPNYIIGTPQAQSEQVDLYGLVRADFHVDGGRFVFDGGLDLTGTQVTIYFAGNDSQPYAATVTQSDGTFGELLPSGTYDLKATNPLFVPGFELGVVVGPDGGSDGGFQLLSQAIAMAINPARLTGSVEVEVDPNIVDAGLVSDGGAFAPEAGILVDTAFGGSGATDPSGVFTISNLLGAPDTVFFVAPTTPYGETYHASAASISVNLKPGLLTNMGQVQLFLDRGTITGKVKMVDGTPALGVTVSLDGTNLAALVSPEADPSIGDFQFNNVPVHPNYSVSAAAPHYSTAHQTVSAAFLGNGATVDVGTLDLAPLQGDFAITSSNPQSRSGFTDTLSVFIFVTGEPSGATQLRLAENPNFTAADGGTVPWVSLTTTTPGNAFTLLDADGFHTVYAQYQDTASPPVQGPVLSSTILVDRVRPTQASVAVTSGKIFANTNQNISITLLATDPNESASVPGSGLGGMIVAESFSGSDLDGGLLPGTEGPYKTYSTYPPDGSTLTDGPYTVFAQFYDNAGNASAVVSTALVVDTIAPTGNLTITSLTASNTGFTNSPLVLVNEFFGLPDGGESTTPAEPNGGTDTIQLANDSNSVGSAPSLPASAQQTWALDTSSGDGTKEVWMIITDSAGNKSPLIHGAIFLERQAPLGTVDLIAPSAGGAHSVNPVATNATTVTLQYTLNGGTVQDPPAVGVEASEQPTGCGSIPASSYQSATGTTASLTYTFAASGTDGGSIQDGNKVIFSCLRDAAGNTTQLESQVVLNRQDPTTAITVGDGAIYQNVGGTVSVDLSGFSSDITGVAVSTSQLTCDDATYEAFSAANPIVQVATPTDGSYTVYVCVEDAAGNVSTMPITFTFTRDTVNPTILGANFTNLSNASANATNSPIAGVTFTGFSKPVVAYRISTDQTFAGVPLTNFSATGTTVNVAQQVPYSLPGTDGVKQVYVQVSDQAGNLSTPATALAPVTLIQAPPTATTDIYVGGVRDPVATMQGTISLQFTVSASVAQVAASSSPQACAQLPASVWQNLSGTPPTLSFSLPGTGNPASSQSVYVCFQDIAGNTTSTVNTITYDHQPPTALMIVGNGNAYQNVSGNVPVTFSAFSPDTSGVVVSTSTSGLNCGSATYGAFNPANPTTTVNVGSTSATDGVYTVYACIKDVAGNPTTIPPFTFTKDTVNPTITSIHFTTLSDSANNATNAQNVGVTFGGFTGPVVAYRVSTDQTFAGGSLQFTYFAAGTIVAAAQSVPFTLPSTGDGTYTVYAQVQDLAGNLSTPATQITPVKLIQTQPTATTDIYVGAVKNPAATNQANITLQFTVSSNLTQVSASSTPQACSQIPSSGWQNLSGAPPTLAFTLPGSGNPASAQSVYVCFQDSAGNTTSTVNTITFNKQPPTATMTVGNGNPYQNVSGNVPVTFSGFSGDTTGVVVSTGSLNCSSATYAVFNPANPTATVNVGSTSGTDGSYTVNACIKDSAGNYTALPSFTFTKDTVTPTITGIGFTVLSNPVANATNSANVGVSFAGFTGPVVAYRLSLDQTFSGGAQPFDFFQAGTIVSTAQAVSYALPAVDGLYTVYAQVQDLAGNLSTPATAITPVHLIQTLPTATTDVYVGAVKNPQATNQSTVTLQFTVSANVTQVSASSTSQACSQLPASAWQNLSGSPPQMTFALSGSGNPPNVQSIYVCFQDLAHNVVSTVNSITYDTQAPSAVMTVGSGAAYQNVSGNVPVTFSSFSLNITGSVVSTGALNCASATYGAFNPASPVSFVNVGSTSATDGPYTVSACLKDWAGNTTALPSFTFTKDTVNPTITAVGYVSLSGTNATNSQSVQVAFTGFTGSVTSYRLSTDQTFSAGALPFNNFSLTGGAVTSPQAAVPFTLPSGDGNKTVYAQVQDLAGNWSTPATALTTIKLIQTAPSATTDIYVGAVKDPAYTNAATVTLQFTVSANLIQVYASAAQQQCGSIPAASWQNLSGAPPTMSFPLAGTGNPSQLESVYTCFRDAANNYASTTNSITYSTQSPIATMLVGNGQPYQNVSGNIPVVFSSFSADTTGVVVSTTALTCSTATYNPFNSSSPSTTVNVGTTSATDGPFTIYACLKDAAGNTSSSPLTFSFTKDTVNPTITGTSVTGLSGVNATNQPNIGVNFSGFTGPVASYRLSTDQTFSGGAEAFTNFAAGGVAVSGAQGPISFTLPSGDGNKTVYAQVQDLAGNLSTPATALTTIKLIQTQPSATTDIYVGAVKDPSYTDASTVTLQFTVSANLTQVYASAAQTQCSSIPTGSWQNLSGAPPTMSFALTGTGNPAQLETVYTCFRDAANNYASTTNSITYSTQAPIATMLVGNGQPYQNVSGSVPVVFSSFSADTTGVVVATTSLTCSSATYGVFNTSSPSTTVALGADGAYTIYACLKDAAGNTSPVPLTFSFTKDTANPTILGTSVSGLTGVNATSLLSIGVNFTGFTGPVASYRLSTDQTFSGGAQAFTNFAAGGVAVSGPQGPIAFTLPSGDGNKTVYAQVQDLAGNLSTPATALTTIKLIQTQPSATTDIYVGAVKDPAYTNASTVTLQFTVSANLTQVYASASQTQCSSIPTGSWQTLSGAPPTMSFALTGTGNPAQLETVYTCFRDAANNYASATNSITFSTQSPIATMVVGNGQAYQNVSGSVPVVFSSFSADTTGVVVSTGALTCSSATYGAFNTSSPSTTVAVASDGAYTVSACLKDAAGNTSTAPLTFSFTKDTVNPTISGTSFSGLTGTNATNQPNVGVNFSGFTGPVSSYRLSTDQTFSGGAQAFTNFAAGGTAVSGAQGPIPFTLPTGDGNKTVYAQVQDLAGNLSSPATALTTIKLIQTLPSATTSIYVGAVQNPPYTNVAGVSLQFTVSANLTQEVASSSPLTCSSTLAWLNLSGAPPTVSFTLTGSGNPSTSQTVYVCFRDAANNFVSTTNSIIYSTVAPTATMTVGSGSAYQNVSGNVPVTFSNFPADLTGVSVSTGPLTCSSATYSSFSSSNPTYSVNVGTTSATDGSYTVSGCLKDAAGNVTTLTSFTFVKDTIVPTAPIITTPDQTIETSSGTLLPDGGLQVTVTTSGAVTELNFADYQQEGGALSSWTVASVVQGTTTFAFTLNPNVVNTLSLQAVDKAGNTSAPSSVLVTWLPNPPNAPTIKQTWVVNHNASAQVFWEENNAQPSNSSPVANLAGFNVYYDSSSHAGTVAYHGDYASNGASPVFVPVGSGTAGIYSLNLDGLNNLSITYLAVRAVDSAGNVSGSPFSPQEVLLEPNQQPLTQLSSLSLNFDSDTPVRFAQSGDNIYLAYAFGPLADAGCSVTLQVVNEGTLTSPVQGGTVGSAGTAPSVVYSETFYDPMSYYPSYGAFFDLKVDGPYLYLADGNTIRAINITTPTAPTVAATVTTAAYPDYQMSGLAVMGDKVYAGMSLTYAPGGTGYPTPDPVNSVVLAVDFSTLYDRNAATSPSASSVFGSQTNPYNDIVAGGMVVDGTNLLVTGDYLEAFKINDTLTNTPAWVAADVWPLSTNFYMGESLPSAEVGGNLMFANDYLSVGDGFEIVDLNPLSVDGGVHVLANEPWGGAGQLDVEGTFALTANDVGQQFSMVNVSTPTGPLQSGVIAQVPPATLYNPDGDLLIGNYAMLAYQNPATLQFYLTSAPVALSYITQVSTGGSGMSVGADLLYAGDGEVFDLTSSSLAGVGFPWEANLCAFGASCSWPASINLSCAEDSTWFDNQTLVQAQGAEVTPDAGYLTDGGFVGYLAVLDTQGTINRTGTPAVSGYAVPLPAGERATAVKAYGNYLIVGEIRTTGTPATTGPYVEIFDARTLRANHQRGNLTLANSLGSVQLASFADDGLVTLFISVRDGVAAVTLDEPVYTLYPSTPVPTPAALNGAGAWLVNLEPAMVDSATSTLSSTDIIATLAVSHPRGSKLHGNDLYVATSQLPDGGEGGLSVLNVAAAFTSPPYGSASAPAVDAGMGFVQIPDADSLDVVGSYAMVQPQVASGFGNADALVGVDISNPSAPFISSSLPMSYTYPGRFYECYAFQPTPTHTSVKLAGPQAFVSSNGVTAVVNLQ